MIHRHAYCIIAHNDVYCLDKLIRSIDDERNDIFLVLDKKSFLWDISLPEPKRSKLFVVEKEKAIDISWGGISQVKAELLVLSLARKEGNYEYFHLLSGTDLPLKNQDYIHQFFERVVSGKNCININGNVGHLEDVRKINCEKLHLFTDKLRHHNRRVRKAYSFIRNGVIQIQSVVGYKRSWKGYKISKGTNWVSINKHFANFLLSRKKEILSRFTHVLGPDEIYKQTMFVTYGFEHTRFMGEGEVSDNLRKIDWKRGLPYVWRKHDFNELITCKEIFARKFSSTVDKEIIDMIFNSVQNGKENHQN